MLALHGPPGDLSAHRDWGPTPFLPDSQGHGELVTQSPHREVTWGIRAWSWGKQEMGLRCQDA